MADLEENEEQRGEGELVEQDANLLPADAHGLSTASFFAAVAKHMHGRLCSFTTLADRLQRDRRRVAEAVESLAAALECEQMRAIRAAIDYLTALSRSGDLKLLGIVSWRKYDETKLKVRVAWKKRAIAELEPGAKTFVLERGVTLLAEVHREGIVDKFVCLRFPLTTAVRVAENMSTASTLALIQACLPKVDISAFPVHVEAICTDQHASNMSAERLRHSHLSSAAPPQMSLHLVCDVHKVSALAKTTYGLTKPFLSRLLQLGLWFQAPNTMPLLREAVKGIVTENAQRVLEGHAGVPAALHRKAVHEAFLSETSAKALAIKHACSSLLNGDYSSTTIRHYCSGCCIDELDAAQKIWHLIFRPLLSRRFRIFPKSNFLGHDTLLNQLGLLASLHNLLQRSMVRAFGFTVHHDMQNEVQQVELDENEFAPVLGDEEGEFDEVARWREANIAARSGAAAFISSAHHQQDLLLLRVILEPQVALMRLAPHFASRIGSLGDKGRTLP